MSLAILGPTPVSAVVGLKSVLRIGGRTSFSRKRRRYFRSLLGAGRVAMRLEILPGGDSAIYGSHLAIYGSHLQAGF